MAVVMVIEFDDHESEIDYLIVDVDDDCRRCQMTSIESVDENVDVNESAIAIVIEIVIDDDVSVKVIVNTDAMMTSMTMMMMTMMMMVVMARRMLAVVLPSRHHVTR